MQRAEMEELRQREANITALQAIGSKKRKLEGDSTTTGTNVSFDSILVFDIIIMCQL